MKYIITLIIVLFCLPTVVLAKNSGRAVTAGITPDSLFYFLDRLDEEIERLLTFRLDEKIRLDVRLAAEREAEAKEISKNDGSDSEKVEEVMKLLDEHISDAKIKIKMKKEKGGDVSEWESEIEIETIKNDDDGDDSAENEDKDEERDEDEDEDDDDTYTTTKKPTTPTTSSTPVTIKSYTMAEVALHNSRTNCWAAVSGSVYDLTSWIGQHPGGSTAIIGICGLDATSAFTAQHSGQARPVSELSGFKIGVLK